MLSNGHGEDLIALRILEALHRLEPQWRLKVMPLVGEGRCFQKAVDQGWLQRIGPSARLPSGGFSNQSLRGLLADLVGGLPMISIKQWICLRRERTTVAGLLAVGDLLPLLMAWTCRRPFAFVGTPKSDYTWSSGPGSSFSDRYHALKGSEWDPWEWTLMRTRRCRLVVMRDRLTARGLRRHGINALAPGNPMMDGFMETTSPHTLERCRRILLLCGSRMPEALRNFRRLLKSLISLPSPVPLAVMAALGSTPTESDLVDTLQDLGFRRCPPPSSSLQADQCWVRGPLLLLLGSGRFERWAPWAEIGIATAGTATEQLVGLGKPALSLPGPGPQFTLGFAQRQSRLLGGAVQVCANETELTQQLEALLENHAKCQLLGQRGRQRMGSSGGSKAIARAVIRALNPGG